MKPVILQHSPSPPKGEQRDLNEPAIVKTALQLGAYVEYMPGYVGYDLIIAWQRNIYFVEIKNPEYLRPGRSPESMLTANERRAKALIEATGNDYLIVLYPLELLQVLGADFS